MTFEVGRYRSDCSMFSRRTTSSSVGRLLMISPAAAAEIDVRSSGMRSFMNADSEVP